jgi:hypothetical protein
MFSCFQSLLIESQILYVQVTPLSFRQYILNTLFPSFGINKKISQRTSTHWMYKLGFKPQEYWKSLYFDDNEQPDVVEARKKFIQDYGMYRKQSRIYGGDNLEISTSIDPETLGNMKETVIIFHDESTVHAKEKP